jgi:hypothetical protein
MHILNDDEIAAVVGGLTVVGPTDDFLIEQFNAHKLGQPSIFGNAPILEPVDPSLV